jgi:hypothetical protein
VPADIVLHPWEIVGVSIGNALPKAYERIIKDPMRMCNVVNKRGIRARLLRNEDRCFAGADRDRHVTAGCRRGSGAERARPRVAGDLKNARRNCS